MVTYVPDIERLARIFAQATAPTFFLGAVAAFVSLMSSRLYIIIDRMRHLNAISQDDPERGRLRRDLVRLRKRAKYLSSGMFAALAAGVCATILLAIMFMAEFAGLEYAFGSGILFMVATILLGFSLIRFGQEVWVGISEEDEHE